VVRAVAVLGLLVEFALIGCRPAFVTPTEFPRDATGRPTCRGVPLAGWVGKEPLPEIRGPGYRGKIVPPEAAVVLLCRCSRTTLGPPDAYWTPSAADIADLECGLALYVRDHPPRPGSDQWRHLERFERRYLGVIRNGVRSIAVDLSPVPVEGRVWRGSPGVNNVCDGGPQFFGVEYDVDGRRFRHIDYNGEA
jgi:hypothetical protein